MTRTQVDAALIVTQYQPWQIVRMAPETCPALASEIIETFYREIPLVIDGPEGLAQLLGREPETSEDDVILNRKAWRIDLNERPYKRLDEAVYLVWSDINGISIEATLTTSGAVMFEAVASFLSLIHPSDVVPRRISIL